MKSLSQANLKGKRILLRVDLNSPIQNNEIQDDTRLRESLPTIQFLLAQGAKQIILLAHQGRPKGIEDSLRLTPHATHLSKLLDQEVLKLNDAGQTPPPPDAPLVLLENVRFYAEKSKNQTERLNFAKSLARLGDIYINDAFGTCHRSHATITDLPTLLPEHYSGLLLEKEVRHLSPLLQKYQKPLTLIFGGAKIDTKIGVIRNYIDKDATFLIGGGLANTFLQAQGYEVGKSLVQHDALELAQEIMLLAEKNQDKFLLPTDSIVADEASPSATAADLPVEDITPDMQILDIGTRTIKTYESVIASSGTIIWNGPLGLFEIPQFSKGTESIAFSVAASSSHSVIGGGDTLDALKRANISHEKFSHVSTGGGAMLEFLTGKTLPGIAALR